MVCLDSDLLISFLRGNEAAVKKVSALKEGGRGPLRTTVINEYELLKGARLSKLRETNEAQVRLLIAGMEVLELDSDAVEAGAALFDNLREAGRMVNEFDVLIAGIVLRNRETLVSGDGGFKGMPGLNLDEWR